MTAKLIGNKIKEYFSEIGMSQMDVAKVLDVQQAAVSNQLNGRPFGKNSAAKWNKAFGFRINWLLTGEGPMFDTNAAHAREYVLEDHPELNHDDDIPVIPARLFRAPDINIYEYVMNPWSRAAGRNSHVVRNRIGIHRTALVASRYCRYHTSL